jgi:hypothetical protein
MYGNRIIFRQALLGFVMEQEYYRLIIPCSMLYVEWAVRTSFGEAYEQGY